MNSNLDISTILSNNENRDNTSIVKERLKRLPQNSVIWSFGNLFQIRRDRIDRTSEYWPLERIFDMRKERETRYLFSKTFSELTNEIFEMRCILCDYKCNYYLKSKSCLDMLNHIREKHLDICGEADIKQRKDYCTFLTCKDDMIKKCNGELVAMIITSYSPFSLVSNPHFQEYSRLLNENYIPPSRNTITNEMIPLFTERAKKIIKEEIKNSEGICATIDGWTCNYTGKHYYSFTCHYLRNSILISRVLSLKKILVSFNSDKIKNFS